jgi:hypothetical protein
VQLTFLQEIESYGNDVSPCLQTEMILLRKEVRKLRSFYASPVGSLFAFIKWKGVTVLAKQYRHKLFLRKNILMITKPSPSTRITDLLTMLQSFLAV